MQPRPHAIRPEPSNKLIRQEKDFDVRNAKSVQVNFSFRSWFIWGSSYEEVERLNSWFNSFYACQLPLVYFVPFFCNGSAREWTQDENLDVLNI